MRAIRTSERCSQAVGRAALTRATHPENVRLKRIAFNEAAQFPEFNVSAESMMWAGRQRAVTDLLRRYEERGTIKVDDLELALAPALEPESDNSSSGGAAAVGS